MKKTLYLIDVSSLFFRAFYAIRPLSSPSGLPVNAIYGFYSMLFKLFKDESPHYMVFCYDRKEPSFRKELYVEYKAHRTEMPEDLGVQIPYIKRMADIMGIPSLEVDQFEADDIIGTLTRLGIKNDFEVQIVSGDKDFVQLIEPGVFLYDTMKNIKYDAEKAKEKWGIYPPQMIDYLALVGDASDNIPGVKGIGPKGALQLLADYSSVEKIYENLDAIKSESLKKKLLDAKEMALLSKRLVTISLDVPVSSNIEDYLIRNTKAEEVLELFKELNFQAMEKTFLEVFQNRKSLLQLSADAAAKVVADASPGPMATTKSDEPLDMEKYAHLADAKLELPEAEDPHYSWEAAVTVEKFFSGKNDDLGAFIFSDQLVLVKIFGPDQHLYLEVSPLVHSAVQDAVRSHQCLAWWGYDVKYCWRELGASAFADFTPRIAWDNQLFGYAVQCLDATHPKALFKKYLSQELPENLVEFLDLQLQLRDYFEKNFHESFAEKIYQTIDRPLAEILYQVETNGIKIDGVLLAKESQELEKEVRHLEAQIHEVSKEKFNVASPKQLAVVLFEKLGLPAARKTKTGYSTDNEVLEKIDHPIAKLVLEFRELSKLKSTYVDALPLMADKATHRVHTCFNQALTATGRLSSNNPNLQNIPIRTERGRRVRQAFIAENGHQLLSIDYSQIELRILAHVTEDPNLMKAFEDDLDVHTATAAEVFGIELSDVTPDLRRTAKAINFGIAYGQGAYGLAESLGISRNESKDIIQKYFHKFQGVQNYIEATIRFANENGYVESLFGRRRYLDELKSKSPTVRNFGERAAINAPIQGTSSDLIKKAMIDIAQFSKLSMILQVHDELIFEGTQELIAEEAPKIKLAMEQAMTLKVPLKANVSVGMNWDQAH